MKILLTGGQKKRHKETCTKEEKYKKTINKLYS